MADTLEAKVADLSERLAILEGERGVLKTLHRYGHSIDYGDEDGFLDCFTSDGSFEVRLMPAGSKPFKPHGLGEATDRGVIYRGQAALKSFVSTHTRAPGAWHKHFMVEPQINLSVDGRQASNQCYFARLDDREGQRVIVAFGRYVDDLVLGPDGRWRFRQRVAELESVG